MFDAIAGGAGDELTLAANREAIRGIRLRPKALVRIRERDLSTVVFGDRMSLPVILAPTGFSRMTHREAELATARAAGAAGVAYTLGTASSYRLEDVADVSTGPKWFQLYVPEDRSAGQALVGRAEQAGFSVLCVTIDTPMHGLRERDKRNHMTVPFKIRPRTVAAIAARPQWTFDFLRGGAGRMTASRRLPMSVKEAGRVISRVSRPVTVEDIHWLRGIWPHKLVVKGVLRHEDARSLVGYGIDGIVVSNHGGRQLDTAVTSIEALPEVVDAVRGQVEIIIDSGFRRGSDVAKALALGASGVMVGRPYLYGLAVGGQAGVARVLDILRQELDTTMGLLGCPDVQSLDASVIFRPGDLT